MNMLILPRFTPVFRRHGLLAVLSVLLLIALQMLPQPARAADRTRIESFLQVTGFDVALDAIGQSAGAAPTMLGLDPGAFGAEWERLSAQVFDTKVMRRLALELLQPTLKDDWLDHAMAFYGSALGKRLVAAENAAQSSEANQSEEEEGAQLLEQMRAENAPRAALFDQMIDVIGGTEASVRALQEIQYRFLMAASVAGVIELHTDSDGLRALLDENRAELTAEIRQSSLDKSAYTYRDFSDEEIAQYIEALKTPEMQKVYELLNAVQFEVMANRFEVLAGRMATLGKGEDI
ncbi:hypothetical protein GCM10010961_04670 [Pseudodonghicola xiamenensis]|uniref:DUF2059 domain-containing protein n=2 Tax=Pseudodonghicola xiamenensis TaxID=337702 RepID=A0A8J3H2Y0_9RHOB|nr:hypothetical protein GCM10010961_04670 [Pseudodonghicola xiamenensis]